MSEAVKEQRTDVGAQRIARVYARAFLDAAERSGESAAVLAELDALLAEVFQSHPDLEALITGGAIGRIARRQVIERSFSGRMHPTLYNFLQVLNDHERLNLLRAIAVAAHELDDERNNRLRVLVSTAVPLEQEFRDRIANGVRTIFHLEPLLIERVEPGLLGGLKLQIGDRVYDSTVRTRIETIKQNILARSSHEIQSRRDRLSTQ